LTAWVAVGYDVGMAKHTPPKKLKRKTTVPSRPNFITRVAVSEEEEAEFFAKASAHGIPIAELVRRAVKSYPSEPTS